MRASAPAFASNDGVIDTVRATLGASLIDAAERVGEIALYVERDAVV
ncbi:MAG: NADH-quinone oxidoreductase subunit C, partial [Sphingomonas sp.]